MLIVVVPASADAVPCPKCGFILRNLANLGASREIACLCGETVMIERRAAAAGEFYPAQKNRRRS